MQNSVNALLLWGMDGTSRFYHKGKKMEDGVINPLTPAITMAREACSYVDSWYVWVPINDEIMVGRDRI